MYRNLRRSPYAGAKWDLLVWYSPPIFFGPLISALRRKSKARTYLILRDIFPEWAVDLGLVRRGPVYLLFKAIAAFQYAVAEVIGVQTQSNVTYLSKWADPPRRRIEVLHNWLTVTPDVGCSILVSDTALAGRKIFVYIGNMGVAQGMDIFMELVQELRSRDDIGFLFVGRGSEFARLEAYKAAHDLNNVYPRLARAVSCRIGSASSGSQDAQYSREIRFLCPVWAARAGPGQRRDGSAEIN